MEDNGGATSSFGYTVLLVPAGQPPSKPAVVAGFYGALRSERAWGVNPRWLSDSALQIQYLKARTAGLEPQGRSVVTVENRAISVSLKDGISDPSACEGGMLRALQLSRLKGGDCGASKR